MPQWELRTHIGAADAGWCPSSSEGLTPRPLPQRQTLTPLRLACCMGGGALGLLTGADGSRRAGSWHRGTGRESGTWRVAADWVRHALPMSFVSEWTPVSLRNGATGDRTGGALNSVGRFRVICPRDCVHLSIILNGDRWRLVSGRFSMGAMLKDGRRSSYPW
jgi:hypothetical protein